MHIIFIQMGGTIDKAYPKAIGGYAFDIGAPATRDILNSFNPSFSYESVSICKKDSQDLTNNDLEQLHVFLKETPHDRIIITHGTDTMIQTGQSISKLELKKTIMITGASRPAAFKDSDAACQIGAAVAACQLLEHGVFISMHGTIKHVSDIQRDKKTGKFY